MALADSRFCSSRPEFCKPLWDNSSLQNKTILLHTNQGLGDAIQFIRYAPVVKSMGARVIVECYDSVKSLFATCPGIDYLAARGEHLPEFDVHTPLMSLPRLLGTVPDSVPNTVPYLQAPETCHLSRLTQAKLLYASAGLKIGLVPETQASSKLQALLSTGSLRAVAGNDGSVLLLSVQGRAS